MASEGVCLSISKKRLPSSRFPGSLTDCDVDVADAYATAIFALCASNAGMTDARRHTGTVGNHPLSVDRTCSGSFDHSLMPFGQTLPVGT